MMGYIAQGNLNIRIHRDTTGLPKDASGKPAPVRTGTGGRRAVWRMICSFRYGKYENDIVRLNLIFLVCYKGYTSLADNNIPTESETKKGENVRGYTKYYIPEGPL